MLKLISKAWYMDRKRIIPIFFIVFTNILGAGVILPILPLVAEDQYGATVFQATLLGAVYFAAQFLAAPWLGRLSDRIGRRPVLIVSQIGTALSFILFSLAGPIGNMIDGIGVEMGIGGGLFILYLARLLDGLTGGNITTAQAYITDVSTEKDRAQALGILSAAFSVGFIFGPAFGGFLAEVSLVAPFIGAAIITTVSVVLTTALLEESLPPEARGVVSRRQEIPLSQFLQDNTILLILTITFVVTLSFAALQSTFALYADRALFPDVANKQEVARNVGLILTGVGVVGVITQVFLIKPLVQRFGERQVVIIGQASLVFAFVGLAMATTPLLAALFIAPVAFGNGVNQPSLQSLITRFGTRQTRGRLLGLYQSANSLALILGPVWAGFVFQTVSPRAPYAMAAPMLVVAVGLSFLLRRRPIPSQAGASL